MSLDQTQNFVRATIASAVDSADTTIDVTDSNQLPDPADGEYNLILWDVSTFPRPGQDPSVEVVRATALDESADTLSVDRAQENTAAADHPETAVLQLSPTAKMFADIDAKTSALSDDGQTFAGESVGVEDATINDRGADDPHELVAHDTIANTSSLSETVTLDEDPKNFDYFIYVGYMDDEDGGNNPLQLEIEGRGDGDHDGTLVDEAETASTYHGQNEDTLIEPTEANSADDHVWQGKFARFRNVSRTQIFCGDGAPLTRGSGRYLKRTRAQSTTGEFPLDLTLKASASGDHLDLTYTVLKTQDRSVM